MLKGASVSAALRLPIGSRVEFELGAGASLNEISASERTESGRPSMLVYGKSAQSGVLGRAGLYVQPFPSARVILDMSYDVHRNFHDGLLDAHRGACAVLWQCRASRMANRTRVPHPMISRVRWPRVPAACLMLLSMLTAGCKSAPRVRPETTTFAATLSIDLSAMQRLPSGVYIRDVVVGDGTPIGGEDQISLHYAGWLADGTQFDANVPPKAPMTFRLGLNTVIPGWEQGLVGMRRGGQRQIVVPPALGYGSTRRSNIPPNSVLVFLVRIGGTASLAVMASGPA